MSALTVIIPSKTISNLAASVPAVRCMEPEALVAVVSDGDITWQALVETLGRGFGVMLPGESPFVFARNVNIAIRSAGEDADVVVLNDDAILETPQGFSFMQEVARQNPDYGIIGAVTNQTGQLLQQPQKIGLREVEHIAFVCVLIPARTRRLLRESVHFTSHGAEKGNLLTGGYLDERYTGYGSDDLDYCMQVRAAGLKVGVYDWCFVDHNSLRSSFRGDPGAAGDIWPNHRLLRAKWGMDPNPADPQQRGSAPA